MSPADIAVLAFIVMGFAAFMATLAWVSRPARKTPRTDTLRSGSQREHAPPPASPAAAAQ